MREPKSHEGETENMFPKPRPEDVPFEDILQEMRREFKLRRRVYPRWVAAGKMSAEKAESRLIYFEAALMRLEQLANTAGLLDELYRIDREGMTENE